MKTFKQHIKESGYEGDAMGVGTMDQNSVEDSALGAHNIQDPDVLKRVNAFVGSIAEREYLKPQQAVDELREKLHRIGLTVSPVDLNGDNGKIKVRLAVNHVIVLSNVFGVEAACTLLLYKVDKVYWSQLKTILIYLGYLYPHELNNIKVDMNIKKLLEEL